MLFQKNFRDNKIKDNVTVTSSNFSRNNRTTRILAHFMVKNHSKLPIKKQHFDIVSVTLHLKSVHSVLAHLDNKKA